MADLGCHFRPFAWCALHKVGHSCQVVIGETTGWGRLIDEIMNHQRDGLTPGPCHRIWLLVALDPVDVLVFGLNIYMLRNMILMMDFVRHIHPKPLHGR